MTMLASQITSLTVVYSIVYSGVNQRKHQSSATLAFVREIHRGPVNFPHKWPVTRKMFPFDDVIMMRWKSLPSRLNLTARRLLQPNIHINQKYIQPNITLQIYVHTFNISHQHASVSILGTECTHNVLVKQFSIVTTRVTPFQTDASCVLVPPGRLPLVTSRIWRTQSHTDNQERAAVWRRAIRMQWL